MPGSPPAGKLEPCPSLPKSRAPAGTSVIWESPRGRDQGGDKSRGLRDSVAQPVRRGNIRDVYVHGQTETKYEVTHMIQFTLWEEAN